MLLRKSILFSSLVIVSLAMSGCYCGPVGCGPGGAVSNCNGCDGSGWGTGGYIAPPSPLQHLAAFRKSLVCGGGCGEVYYGEWASTPPDGCDPCAGGQFVGGATPCRPFCWNWRPGQLLFGFLHNVGQRFCYGCGNPASACGCGGFAGGGGFGVGCGGCGGGFAGGGCSSCSGGYETTYVGDASFAPSGGNHVAAPQTGTRIAGPAAAPHPTHTRAAATTTTTTTPGSRFTNPAPVNHRTARSQAIRRGVSSGSETRTQYR